MTRPTIAIMRDTIAELNSTVEALRRTLSFTEIGAWLALTTKPDHREVVRESGQTWYDIRAYGLTRCDGGYVVIRFVCKGQRDTVSIDLFDDWSKRIDRTFAIAVERIARKRYEMLEASK